MRLKIEKNVPMPKQSSGKLGYSKTIMDMETGDSFTYPDTKEAKDSMYNAIKNVRIYHNKRDRLFKTMTLGNGKRRIWRIQ